MRVMRRLAVPASESHLTVALVLSVLVMSLMLWGVMYQSGVIVHQRDLIRVLWQSQNPLVR
jgi:hypothetical protein